MRERTPPAAVPADQSPPARLNGPAVPDPLAEPTALPVSDMHRLTLRRKITPIGQQHCRIKESTGISDNSMSDYCPHQLSSLKPHAGITML